MIRTSFQLFFLIKAPLQNPNFRDIIFQHYHQIFEFLEDIKRDFVNYDLEFRIQELESKFSKDMSETTFNELKALKKEKNIN